MKSSITAFGGGVQAHLEDTLPEDAEFHAGITTADSIAYSTRLAVTSAGLLAVSPGFVDTTSELIEFDRISNAEIETDQNRPTLVLSLRETTTTYPLRTEAGAFCESLMTAVERHEAADEAQSPASSDGDAEPPTADWRQTLHEELAEGERLFLTALAAHFRGKQTVPRRRYRQARAKFGDARATLTNADVDSLTPPVSVRNPAPDADPPQNFDRNAVVTEAVEAVLDESGISSLPEVEPVSDATAGHDLSEQSRQRLQLLWAWNDADSFEFRDVTDVDRRIQQSEIGRDLV